MNDYDFCGWATRNDLVCADGRVIRKNAFKENDMRKVPLVWNHDHTSPKSVIGHCLLSNETEGVYAYGFLNDTEYGIESKRLLKHGDIDALSIYANNLTQDGHNVIHGVIREVSLVHAGANPGAFIDQVIAHGADGEEGIVFSYDLPIAKGELFHSDDKSKEDETTDNTEKETSKMAEKTVQDVFDELTDEQKDVVYALIGQALEDAGKTDNDEEDDSDMKHNLFDMEYENDETALMHSAMETIIGDAKRCGSLKESFLQHAQEYGIESIDYLFPEAKSLNNTPEFIKRDDTWVKDIMSSIHKTPFSKVKSLFADITEDEARAKGYFKGNLKKEEVFSLLKRSTSSTTVYKKQKLDRDDVIDITDFDVVAWLKTEMRMMVEEELARAYLIGDGRLASSDDKIDENCIRPVWTDAELFTVNAVLELTSNTTEDDRAKAFIRKCIKARKDYKGSGSPTLYTTEDMLTDCLLLEDGIGRRLYASEAELATTLRVKKIVTVEPMEGLSRSVNGEQRDLMGIIVNMNDYNVGADKGGALDMFEDFDIDYNQMKYLMETRCSGALVKPKAAIVIESKTAA